MTLLFCNIGWMEHYKGLSDSDQIQGGGSYVEEEGRGHEVCNFSEYKGRVYGYVEPVGKPENKQIKLERLGANINDEVLEKITVVWTATRPSGGTVIIGWYKDAKIYRNYKDFKKIPPMHNENSIDGYRIKAPSKTAHLLPLDERTFEIPRQTKGSIGTSNVWYADAPEAKEILKNIKKLIKGKYKNKKKRSKKTDPEKNAKVEKIAIRTTIKYFERLGYSVDSVEKDNVGWDLEAYFKKSKLKIEVKGLSGKDVNVELTSNEYKAFSKNGENYRLCIVNSALTNPRLLICRYSSEIKSWLVEGENEAEIKITPKESASIKINI